MKCTISPIDQRLTILTIGVKDLDLMTDFYEKTLGWKSEEKTGGIVFYKLNGFLLALYPVEALAEDAGVSPARTGFKPFTLAQNFSSEEEVDQQFADLEERGVKIVKKPQKVFWGGYSGYISDPEGNLWELAYNPFMG